MEDSKTETSLQCLASGSMVHARYRVDHELGSGAQASVYLAEDVHLSRSIALKLFYRAEEKLQERFKKEAHLMASLDHPGIVRVYASGETDDGRHFIAMEYVAGGSLADYLQIKGKLTATEFVSIFSKILSALQYLHENSVLHRDLKPENILLEINAESGEIKAKLTDFGIAKIYDDATNASLTQTKGVGTAAYMSPEQCQGKQIDRRADLYSLGCVMYQSLAGKPPFQGDSEYEVMYKHTSSEVPKLSISRDVAVLISKAMAKLPSERWQTADEMLAAMPADTYIGETTAKDASNQHRFFPRKALTGSAVMIVILIVAGYCFQSHRANTTKDLKRSIISPRFDYWKTKHELSKADNPADKQKVRNLANKVLEQTNALPAESTKLRLLAYQALAQLEHGAGNRQKSLEYAQAGIDELSNSKVTDLDQSLHASAYMNRAIRYDAAQQTEAAIADWKTALKYTQKMEKGTRNEQQAYVYQSLANIYLEKKQFKLAEEYARKSIEIASKNSPESGYAMDSKYILSRIMLRIGNYNEAIRLTEHVRTVALKKFANGETYNYYHLPSRLINVGCGLGELGRYKEAIELLKEAEEIFESETYKAEFEKDLAYNWSCRSQGLTSLAYYYQLTGDKARAADTYRKGIEILVPSQSAHGIDTLVGLGLSAQQAGYTDDAVRAWTLAEEKSRLYNDTIAGAVGRPPGILLGQYYLSINQPAKAKAYFESALNFLQSKEPSRIQEIAEARKGISRANNIMR